MDQAVERRKVQVEAHVDPKVRWKQNQAKGALNRKKLAAGVLVPLAGLAVLYGLTATGLLHFGKPSALSAALEAPDTTTVVRIDSAKLGDFPDEIKGVTALKELYLENNGIKEISSAVGELKHLQVLSLSYNELTTLPPSLAGLAELRSLLLKHNFISNFPVAIESLTGLETLDLSNNGLKALPEKIGALRDLRHLRLHGNAISELPKSFGKLAKLQELDLSENPLSALPDPSCFPGLLRLKIVKTGISEQTAAAYKSRLPKVSIMR